MEENEKEQTNKNEKKLDEEKERPELPEIEQLEEELKREREKNNKYSVIKSTLYILTVAAAIAVLITTLLFPVLRVYGTSMTPTLNNDEVIVAMKGSSFKTGDIIAFYYNNKILIKRCIAGPGDWVDIDNDGNVFVNSERLDEPYITEKVKGECDYSFPYQVPDGRYFVLGDHRSVSVDSRNKDIGCIADEHIVGKIIFRVLPFGSFGSID